MQAAGKNQPLFVLRRQAAAELVRADLRFAAVVHYYTAPLPVPRQMVLRGSGIRSARTAV